MSNPLPPAPIPLGAVDHVLGDFAQYWRANYFDGCVISNRERHLPKLQGAIRRALREAPHPVATRETVERVAEALFLSSEQSKFQRETTLVVRHWHDLARAALTAAGFTLQEGALEQTTSMQTTTHGVTR